jgi:fructose-1,6-bisphosphatase/sedoheptulose 1,7-bisphosphatase-like protein
MPAPRYILRDIDALGLDPIIPYREVGYDGRLTGGEDLRREGRRQREAKVELSFEKLEHPRHEHPTGEVIEAHAKVEVIEDGVVIAEAHTSERDVDATPVANSDAIGPDEVVVLASSKKIRANKKAEKAAAPEKVVEKLADPSAEKPTT